MFWSFMELAYLFFLEETVADWIDFEAKSFEYTSSSISSESRLREFSSSIFSDFGLEAENLPELSTFDFLVEL